MATKDTIEQILNRAIDIHRAGEDDPTIAIGDAARELDLRDDAAAARMYLSRAARRHGLDLSMIDDLRRERDAVTAAMRDAILLARGA